MVEKSSLVTRICFSGKGIQRLQPCLVQTKQARVVYEFYYEKEVLLWRKFNEEKDLLVWKKRSIVRRNVYDGKRVLQ